MAGFAFLCVVAFANLALGFCITVRLWPKSTKQH